MLSINAANAVKTSSMLWICCQKQPKLSTWYPCPITFKWAMLQCNFFNTNQTIWRVRNWNLLMVLIHHYAIAKFISCKRFNLIFSHIKHHSFGWPHLIPNWTQYPSCLKCKNLMKWRMIFYPLSLRSASTIGVSNSFTSVPPSFLFSQVPSSQPGGQPNISFCNKPALLLETKKSTNENWIDICK